MLGIQETFVVYYSKEDGVWLAHGLRTDQVGTGDCVVDAVADLITALDQVAKLVERDKDIEVYRDAPAEIQRMVATAKPLPGELYEISHRRARGSWPKDLAVHVQVAKTKRYTSRILEGAAAK